MLFRSIGEREAIKRFVVRGMEIVDFLKKVQCGIRLVGLQQLKGQSTQAILVVSTNAAGQSQYTKNQKDCSADSGNGTFHSKPRELVKNQCWPIFQNDLLYNTEKNISNLLKFT